MVELDYKKLYKDVGADIAKRKQELGKLIQQEEALEALIAGLQTTAAGLGKLVGEEYIAEDALGLTGNVRNIFFSDENRNYTATEIRDALAIQGYDLTKYGNALASIHSVIKRLLEQGQIVEAGTRGSTNKPAYSAKKGIAAAEGTPNRIAMIHELLEAAKKQRK
jgi:hypothetical protein